ncbi:MAG: TrbI/VirB10 family protein [Burkholderiales bacterium]|nr:TrbI/VirB10 family protein [Burkholderiales bacterium]
MAESLIKPELAKPRGTPPKKLLIGVFVLLIVVVLLLSLVTTGNSEPANTGDGLARDAAATLTDADRVDVGRAAPIVREAATTSGLPADFRGDGRPASPIPPGLQKPPSEGAPATKPAAAASAPAGHPMVDPAVAARELEVLNSRLVVFDQEDKATPIANGSNASGAGPAERAQGDDAGGTRSRQSGSDSLSVGDQIAKRIAAAKDQDPQSSPRQRDNKFLQEFADQRRQAGLRPNEREAANMVLEGTVIPAVLIRDVVTDLPGVVTAMVNRDVYDSIHPQRKLICKGSRLVGRYNNEVKAGQGRMLFAFSRLILPDGSSFDLPGFDGSDQSGRAGVTGDVDNHYFRIYGGSLLIGLLADRVTKPQAVPQGQNAQMSATGQILTDTARDQLQRFRDVSPTITIERGSVINVEVKRDLIFPASVLRGCT